MVLRLAVRMAQLWELGKIGFIPDEPKVWDAIRRKPAIIRLIEIFRGPIPKPAPEKGIFFWERRQVAPVCIHFPRGQVKKLSKFKGDFGWKKGRGNADITLLPTLKGGEPFQGIM